MIGLTDEEILRAIQEAYNRPDLEVEYVSDQDRVVAKAQVKKVYEEGRKQLFRIPDGATPCEDEVCHLTLDMWQTLLEGVK